METQKIFWENPYLTKINAKICSVRGSIVTLDKTIAFAFCGGQQSDTGTIGGYEILEAIKDEREIFYEIAQNHCLKVGDYVDVEIDWEKRYKLMKLHFSAELVLELIYQEFNKPKKIGANITDNKARIDFYWDGNISEIFPIIKDKIKNLIDLDLDIFSDYSDMESERRYWEIKGFAKVPCGGTHLRKTGEIGLIDLKRHNLGKGKERIEIYLK